MRYWTSSHVLADGPVCITLVYLYDEAALDVDNLLKPIHSILKFFQVDSMGMCRMTSSARYFK
jgi:hypothetical protein